MEGNAAWWILSLTEIDPGENNDDQLEKLLQNNLVVGWEVEDSRNAEIWRVKSCDSFERTPQAFWKLWSWNLKMSFSELHFISSNGDVSIFWWTSFSSKVLPWTHHPLLICNLEVESLRYSYFCLHVQPLLKVFCGVRDPRSKQMCDELSCKHLFVEFLYNVSRLYRNWKSNPGNPSYCTEWVTATLMASLECTLAVILLIVLHTSCFTYSSWYVSFFSNLFKSPKFGPKNPWEFWNPETQTYTWNQKCIQIFPGFESSKIPSPNGSDQVNLSPSMQVSGPGNTERGRWKKVGGSFGVLEIFHFIWGKSVNPSFSWKFVEFTPDESEGKKDGIHHLWWFSFQKKHGLNPMVSSNLMVAITTVNPTNAAQHDTGDFLPADCCHLETWSFDPTKVGTGFPFCKGKDFYGFAFQKEASKN